MLFLYTDFGLEGPYVGQMRAAIAREAPGVPVVDLCHDLPPFEPRPAAYLLAALVGELPAGAAVVGVVDPGVGGERGTVVLNADGRLLVGPDNGLFAITARRAREAAWHRLTWQPDRLSASFHGRDLFAPAAARLLLGRDPGTAPLAQAPVGHDWPDQLAEIIYCDRYGNAMTGLRATDVAPDARLAAGGRRIGPARTFTEVAPGEAFWYENSSGLAEIAVNQGRADIHLGLSPGVPVAVELKA